MKKDNSKFQKQAPLLVFCQIFLFSDQPSKSSGYPFSKAKGKAAKVVKFVAMWLNLNPHTVIWGLEEILSPLFQTVKCIKLFFQH